jgi:hypothetical protein
MTAKTRTMKQNDAEPAKVPVVKNSTTPGMAPSDLDYFQLYGEQASQRPIVGRLLKFNKGDWLAGENQDEIPTGTRLVVSMETLKVGWVKWLDSRIEQDLTGLVCEGFRPQKRADLGDTDEALWEIDDDEKPRDPWTFSNTIVMASADDPEDLYTYSTSSKGGLNAVGDLCKTYSAEARLAHCDELPIIELGADSYNHPNKQFGRIKFPTMSIVGWVKKGGPAKKEDPKRVSGRK